MVAAVSGRVGRVRVAAAWLAVSLLAPAAIAQSAHALAGLVVDQADAVLPGARVSVADSSGRVLHTTTTNGEGRFSVVRLSPGAYTVTVELPLFVAAVQHVTVAPTGASPALRFVLAAGGFSEDVVVTGRRVETRITDTPQKVESGRCDGYRTHRGGGPDRRPQEERGGRRHPVRGRALRHRHPRVPSAVLGHQQAFAAAHRRPAVRRDESRNPAAWTASIASRSSRAPPRPIYGSSAMGGVVNVITRQSRGQDWRHGARRRRQLRDLRVLRTRRWQRVVACRLRSGRRAVRPARRLSDGQRRRPAGDQLQNVRRLGTRRRGPGNAGVSKRGARDIAAATS